jgi:hypothetical protein
MEPAGAALLPDNPGPPGELLPAIAHVEKVKRVRKRILVFIKVLNFTKI